MVLFYKICKKYNEIQQTKNKMELSNEKRKNKPLSQKTAKAQKCCSSMQDTSNKKYYLLGVYAKVRGIPQYNYSSVDFSLN